jgi:hypothetical protein
MATVPNTEWARASLEYHRRAGTLALPLRGPIAAYDSAPTELFPSAGSPGNPKGKIMPRDQRRAVSDQQRKRIYASNMRFGRDQNSDENGAGALADSVHQQLCDMADKDIQQGTSTRELAVGLLQGILARHAADLDNNNNGNDNGEEPDAYTSGRNDEPVTKGEMDRAVRNAQDGAARKLRAMDQALRLAAACGVSGMALDKAASPTAIFRVTLRTLGYRGADGLANDAVEPTLRAWIRRPAQDRALAGGSEGFRTRFPEAASIRYPGWRPAMDRSPTGGGNSFYDRFPEAAGINFAGGNPWRSRITRI